MKKITAFFVGAAVSVLGFSFSYADSATVEISGMKCGDCVKNIEKSLCKMKGVTKCEVSVGKAIIETDSKTALNEKTIADLVAGAGHYKMQKLSTSK
jgi:copper chaperone CopZ